MGIGSRGAIYESGIEDRVAPGISDVMTQDELWVYCTSSWTTLCAFWLGTFCDLNLITAAESKNNVEGVLRRSIASALAGGGVLLFLQAMSGKLS